MNALKFKILIASILLLSTNYAVGQGCSDAGFCTMNSFKPGVNDSSARSMNQVKIGVSYGMADNSISVIGNYIEYNRLLNDKLGIDIKATSVAQNGNDVSVFGISDAYINATYLLRRKFKLTVGAKIPFSKADKMQNEQSLPMDYQSSLGTFDLIFGIGFEVKKMQVVAALQHPLSQNDNHFFSTDFARDTKLSEFQSTNNFKRSGDVLLRVSYPFSLNKKLKLTPGILPIYHLTNDKYTDTMNVERVISGSQGLTLNGNVFLTMK